MLYNVARPASSQSQASRNICERHRSLISDAKMVASEEKLYFPVDNLVLDELFDWSRPHLRQTYRGNPLTRTGCLVNVNGHQLALFRFGSLVVACDEKCPHQGGALHVGDLEELPEQRQLCVVCPAHRWKFAASSGRTLYPSHRTDIQLKFYPTIILPNGHIQIGFDHINGRFFKEIIV